jgi:hypothetical protein
MLGSQVRSICYQETSVVTVGGSSTAVFGGFGGFGGFGIIQYCQIRFGAFLVGHRGQQMQLILSRKYLRTVLREIFKCAAIWRIEAPCPWSFMALI